MSEYSIYKRIPSCNVEKTLVKNIETYILRKGEEISVAKEKTVFRDKGYSFSITDSRGTEILNNSDEFSLAYYPEDIKKMYLSLRYLTPELSISVMFNNDFPINWSRISIEYRGPSAKETALGVLVGIEDIIRPYKNKNFFYHFPFFLFALVALGGFLAMLMPHRNKYVFSGLVFLALYFIAGRLKPYVTFQTHKNEEIRKWFNWLIFGIVGYLFYSVFGEWLKKKFLGS